MVHGGQVTRAGILVEPGLDFGAGIGARVIECLAECEQRRQVGAGDAVSAVDLAAEQAAVRPAGSVFLVLVMRAGVRGC